MKKGLTSADMYVRIRPLAASGGHSAEADGNNTKISLKVSQYIPLYQCVPFSTT